MNKCAFDGYAWFVPPVLAPLSFWLWWRTFDENVWLALVAWLVPVVYAYVIPAVGTNLLKVWEFDTRLRLGRFRPHHGFVFGSATAMIAWLVHAGVASAGWGIVGMTLLLAGVLGLVNIVYDIFAIQAGYLHVYNQPWAEGKQPVAIVMDYAPWFFGLFGGIHGAGIGAAETLAANGAMDVLGFIWLFPLVMTAAIVLPVLGYRWSSFLRHGHSGCRPVARIVP